MKRRHDARLCAKCSQDGPDPIGASRLQWDSEVVAYPVNLRSRSPFRPISLELGCTAAPEKAGSASKRAGKCNVSLIPIRNYFGGGHAQGHAPNVLR